MSERDIVERLRLCSPYIDGIALHNLIRDAAATIETLRAEVKAAREAPDSSELNEGDEEDSNVRIMAMARYIAAMDATDASGALGKEAADGE